MTNPANNHILVINCGSSSLKFSIYDFGAFELKMTGTMSGIGEASGHLKISNSQGHSLENKEQKYTNLPGAVKELVALMSEGHFVFNLTAIGHRLVQGGPDHREPELITAGLLKSLREFVYLAPNHLPGELSAIEAFRSAFPNIPQIACFDTAFHKDLPTSIKHYPLPEAYQGKGLIKYGFHGLSYAYVMQKLTEEDADNASKKIIIAHLGNGASMAAVQNGKSMDTTMGMSPIGGLVMATRSGDLDPGVILFLLKQYGLSINELDELLSKRSGLIAIAGTGDMQELLAREITDSTAAEAIKIFCYHAKKQIGALAAAMGGLDILVFTGGIGENSPVIREHICSNMNFLGIELNQQANDTGQQTISLKTSRVRLRVLPTNEELMIAKAAHQVLNQIIINQ
ncbi:acetate kinase [Mucilaginibacter sp. PAMC 26640]|nr:acetate kinase [Mucilaginibacter sp. PAMC 26640]